jgi:hypothetical protein
MSRGSAPWTRALACLIALFAVLASGGCCELGLDGCDDGERGIEPEAPREPDDGGGSPAPVQVACASSATPAGANLVRLVCGTSRGQDVATLVVAIGGPTASGDLSGFAFDLLLSDPGVAEYVPGSAVFGSALVLGPGQTGLVAAGQQAGSDRVKVGVDKSPLAPGNGVGAQEVPIVSLDLRLLRAGSTDVTLVASPPHAAPAALDSNGTVLVAPQAPVFDAGAARIFSN